MTTTKYPYRDAIYKAHTIYRDAMRLFIIQGLTKHPNETPEKLCIKALSSDTNNRPPAVVIKLQNGGKTVETIDIDNFPTLIRKFWDSPTLFSEEFNSDRSVWNESELIKSCRPHWAHPGTEDTDPEEVRTQLYLIIKVLNKINESESKHEVEAIRDQLFPHDITEHPETTLNQLETTETSQTKIGKQTGTMEKNLAVVAAERTVPDEHLADIQDEPLDSEPFWKGIDDRSPVDIPDELVEEKYPIGSIVRGTVIHTADHAVFIKFEDGTEGRIHKADLFWSNSDVAPRLYFDEDDVIEAVVIEIPKSYKWISLSPKYLQQNPWEFCEQLQKYPIKEKYPICTKVTGPVRNVIDSGIFVEIEPGINGFLSTSMPKLMNSHDEIEAIISKINVAERRISLDLSVGADSNTQVQ